MLTFIGVGLTLHICGGVLGVVVSASTSSCRLGCQGKRYFETKGKGEKMSSVRLARRVDVDSLKLSFETAEPADAERRDVWDATALSFVLAMLPASRSVDFFLLRVVGFFGRGDVSVGRFLDGGGRRSSFAFFLCSRVCGVASGHSCFARATGTCHGFGAAFDRACSSSRSLRFAWPMRGDVAVVGGSNFQKLLAPDRSDGTSESQGDTLELGQPSS